MIELLSRPWPWYVAGPLIGLFVPVLLLLTGRWLGVSSSLRHICAATLPGRADYFRYDWKRGAWNLTFVLGLVFGGAIAALLLPGPGRVAISDAMTADLHALGIRDFTGLVPADLISWEALLAGPGAWALIVGGFLVGFGARWAGGCTSGHGITGLATLQKASLVAVIGFFLGGLLVTHLLLPVLL